MIQVKIFTFNAFSENTYVLFDASKEAIIIDPGCYEKHEEKELTTFIEKEKLKVVGIYNTHCHIDHVLGNYFCKEHFKVPLFISEKELPVLKAVKVYAPQYGFGRYTEATHDFFIPEKGEIKFGQSTLKILFVPGHAPGHVAFWSENDDFCVNGDVLFRESVGRTDLPGGNQKQLLESIRKIMFALPEHTVVYCGHGQSTTIGHEKKHNPYAKI